MGARGRRYLLFVVSSFRYRFLDDLQHRSFEIRFRSAQSPHRVRVFHLFVFLFPLRIARPFSAFSSSPLHVSTLARAFSQVPEVRRRANRRSTPVVLPGILESISSTSSFPVVLVVLLLSKCEETAETDEEGSIDRQNSSHSSRVSFSTCPPRVGRSFSRSVTFFFGRQRKEYLKKNKRSTGSQEIHNAREDCFLLSRRIAKNTKTNNANTDEKKNRRSLFLSLSLANTTARVSSGRRAFGRRRASRLIFP